MDTKGLPDPYCRVLVAGKKECKTPRIKRDLNPKWEVSNSCIYLSQTRPHPHPQQTHTHAHAPYKVTHIPLTHSTPSHLQEGRNLPAMDSNGLSDPYCRVLVAGKKECKTPRIKKTLDPKWEPPAEAKFNLASVESAKVEVEVWDKVGTAFKALKWASDVGMGVTKGG